MPSSRCSRGGRAAARPPASTKLIGIWNKSNTTCKFKNETVAGGAGTNAKAVLAQRLAANKPPDSFQGHAGAELRDYIKAGQVEPIDFIYKRYGFTRSCPKSLISQIRYKGHLYSVPVNIHRANILWYNPAVLRKAGIRGPEDLAEFIAALKKAKTAGVIPLVARRAVDAEAPDRDDDDRDLGPARWAALWKGTATGRTRASRLALNRSRRCSTYTNSDAASLTWQDAGKLVVDGKAAFNIMGDWQDGYFSGTKPAATSR